MTQFADSTRVRETHPFSRTQARPNNFRLDGLRYARFNQGHLGFVAALKERRTMNPKRPTASVVAVRLLSVVFILAFF